MNLDYLGVSVKQPFQLDAGVAGLVSGNENIEQAIRILLSTPLGSRFFLPEYGCRLDEVLFEPNDEVLKQMISMFVFEALEKWETRVKFQNIDYEFLEDHVACTISYRILQSNEINSFVYPFFRELKY